MAARSWATLIGLNFVLSVSWMQPAIGAEIPETVETPDMFVVFAKAKILRAETNPATHEPKKVLVAFDTDNTLLAVDQALGSEQWFETEAKTAGPRFARLLTIYYTVIKASQAHLTQPYLDSGIRDLHAQGIQTIVITSRGPALADATVRQLAGQPNNISFGYSGIKHFKLDGGKEIVCRDGICLTDGQDKGKSLLAILKEMNYRPDAVIFVDNDPKYPTGHHQKMNNAVRNAGEPFDLYRYRYAREDNAMREYEEGDRSLAVAELADFKGRGCMETACDRIMSDEEAREWLRQRCASHRQAEMIPMMNSLIYGDPLPLASPCRAL